MATGREIPDPDEITPEDEELDSLVIAQMMKFMEQMIRSAGTVDGVERERATDLLMIAAVTIYAQHHPTTPDDVAAFCHAVAEDILRVASDDDIVH